MPFDTLGLESQKFLKKQNVPMKLVKEEIREMENSWQMKDPIFDLSKIEIDFNSENPIFRFTNNGKVGQDCLITRHALHQLGGYLMLKNLTNGGNINPYNLTEARWQLQDIEIRAFETKTWMKQIQSYKGQELMFRSKIINGTRTITSIQGKHYTPILDSELLKGVSNDLSMAKLEITSEYSFFECITEIKNEKDPVPMIEIHNSSAGTRRLQMFKKLFMQICTNGMKGWKQQDMFANNHYGDKTEILGRYNANMELSVDKDFIDYYMKSREIQIDNAIMNKKVKALLPLVEYNNWIDAMETHDKIASPIGTVGHVYDALTLSAQAKKDPLEKDQVEALAGTFLKKEVETLYAR